jgi:hypothetical protein
MTTTFGSFAFLNKPLSQEDCEARFKESKHIQFLERGAYDVRVDEQSIIISKELFHALLSTARQYGYDVRFGILTEGGRKREF